MRILTLVGKDWGKLGKLKHAHVGHASACPSERSSLSPQGQFDYLGQLPMSLPTSTVPGSAAKLHPLPAAYAVR